VFSRADALYAVGAGRAEESQFLPPNKAVWLLRGAFCLCHQAHVDTEVLYTSVALGLLHI